MKTLFIHASINKEIIIPQKELRSLPTILGLFTNIQHLKQLPRLKKFLEEQGKKITIVGQTLGCRAEAAEYIAPSVEAFLYIGSGEFHPLLVAVQTPKTVYCFNPLTHKITIVDEETIKRYKKKKKANIKKFFTAKTIGVLITTKPGQNDNKINKVNTVLKMKGLKELEKKFPEKKFYAFAFDNLDMGRLEDFNFIECWVNTACSRIADEKKGIVNLDDIRKFSEA